MPSEYGTYNDHDPRPQRPLHLHALPKGHGPASSSTRISSVYSLSSLEHAPTFVKAVGAYDELGRSLADGVDAGVTTGQAKHEEGEGLKFWRNLDLGPSQVGSRAATPSIPPPLERDIATQSRSRGSSPIAQPSPIVAPIAPPIHVPQEQWFIRRALLAKAQKERETQSAEGSPSAAGVSSTAPTRPSTPSLASLLSDSLPPPPTSSTGEEIEGYRPPAYFHLNPSNKGWRVLKNIGWDERGGLGRGSADVRSDDAEREKGVQVKSEDGVSRSSTVIGARVDGTTGTTNDSAIDLTLDSASESDSDQPSNSKSRLQAISPQRSAEPSSSRNTTNPVGRTAPVATYLKTDLRGIGALSSSEKRRALLRPGTLSRHPSHKQRGNA
ncbi:hypothetical protein QFC20_002874 [Naganishia adeliensis]|uniref:Uncharacterized protein n=1 Tax=Naganishia adeliensis TaxID=92952 RepID=A0ACC2WIA2_9TREE|nr:hypothetical protein QFC20_002874 [Naganishia adeliensis]